MNAREYILSKRVPKNHEVTIELADGIECKFLVPLSGVGKSSLERRASAFSKEKPNAVFVGLGLMPAEGYDEALAFGLFFMADTNQEGWSQQDVLEMFNDSPDEVTALFSKLTALAYAKKAEAEEEEVADELKNSDQTQSTDG